jgi:glycosidase
MLLIEGAGLKGAAVSARREGITIGPADCPGEGSALFVELTLAPGLKPGAFEFAIRSGPEHVERVWTLAVLPPYKPAPIGPDDVIYLAMPDRFANGDVTHDSADNIEPMLNRRDPHAYHGGDFAGLKAKLPYLAELGVTALWLTPVYRPAGQWYHTAIDGKPRKFADFHGYSPVDFYDSNPRFGTLAEYRSLVDAAHQLGLKVIQDQILGYTGPRHHWVTAPPGPEWFHGPMDKPPPCNFRFDALANPHALEADRRGMTDGWFFGILPDLNMRNERVARYAIQQSLWWMALSAADGVRLDTYPMVDRAFWRDWSRARHALDARVRAVGEAWVTDAALLSFFQGGRAGWDKIDPGVESVLDFPLNYAISGVAANKAPASTLGKALARDFAYSRPDWLVTFLDNHDTARLISVPGVTPARHRLAAAFLLTTRGIPQLTWGDEINLPGNGDDRQTIPGAWPGDPRDAFTASGRTREEQATFEAYRALLRIRKASPALRRGKTVELAATETVFAYLRHAEDERMVVALNFGAAPARVELPGEPLKPAAKIESVYGEGLASQEGSSFVVEIPAERAAIFQVSGE